MWTWLYFIAWICLYEVKGENLCTPAEGIFRFGTDCLYQCHCKNEEERCNEITGECDSGCATGWMGPGCQYVNLALGQNATQSSTYIHDNISDANRAIDGDLSTSTRTSNEYGPWWRLEFKINRYVSAIRFVLHDDIELREKMRGFRILIGNTSTMLTVCHYDDGRSLVPVLVDVQCIWPMVGRYIQIDSPGSQQFPLMIREVEVYGGRNVAYLRKTAQSSYYREMVQLAGNAVDGKIDGDRSTDCTWTAQQHSPWWKVDLGQKYMVYGFELFNTKLRQYTDYIKNLQVKISNNENFSDAFVIYKDKLQEPSWRTTYFLNWPRTARFVQIDLKRFKELPICEFRVFADCLDNLCGLDCQQKCYCKTPAAGSRKISGICQDGCTRQWTGHGGRCDTAAAACQGRCLSLDRCNSSTQECSECKEGFARPSCTECIEGRWGDDCKKCGHCSPQEPCNEKNGHCSSCQEGYAMPFCEKCVEGRWGNDCRKCGRCTPQESCNVQNGHCFSCQEGYSMPFCQQCIGGRWGNDCTKCGRCSPQESCNVESGHCSNCQEGYKLPFCNNCKPGYWGDNCYSCGQCNNDELCDMLTGVCPSGCRDGYKPPICKDCIVKKWGTDCSSDCGRCLENDDCDKGMGYCRNGCQPGFIEPLCSPAVPSHLESMDETHGDVDAAVIAGGVTAAVAFTCLLVVSVLLLYRWQRRKSTVKSDKKEDTENDAQSKDSDSISSQPRYADISV